MVAVARVWKGTNWLVQSGSVFNSLFTVSFRGPILSFSFFPIPPTSLSLLPI